MIFKSIFKDSLPDPKFNESVSEFYWHQLDVFKDKTIFVDYETNREWNGAQIKSLATKIGHYLVDKLNIKRGDCCAVLYKNCDFTQTLSFGILFSGSSFCALWPAEPAYEHSHILSIIRPKVVFIGAQLYGRLVELRNNLELNYTICIMDENFEQYLPMDINVNLEEVLEFHKHISNYEPASLSSSTTGKKFPVHMELDDPAYILFTSGTTGKQKAVNKSHKNCINVCHCLKTAPQLWDLNETSVLGGFQELDHGTGTLCSQMNLSTGLKSILMDGFNMEQLFEAIPRYGITDFCLGTAYLHNLMQTYLRISPPDRPNLSSLRNIIATGAPLFSHSLKLEFMASLPEVSVRQAYGLTECDLVSIQARDEAPYEVTPPISVGYQLPTIELKLIDHETGKELTNYDCEGELCLRGATLSPGYIRAPKFEEAQFLLSDGFFRTNDICSINREGKIFIKGRYSEFLIFTDGWKVLPSEIEQKLLEHPLIKEAAVIGIPDTELPGCHKPRAYVVPQLLKAGSGNGTKLFSLNERQVYEFVASDLSEPKHLRGGVKIVKELPKTSMGKVDKKALRRWIDDDDDKFNEDSIV